LGTIEHAIWISAPPSDVWDTSSPCVSTVGRHSPVGLTSAILAYLFPRDAVIGLAFGRQVAGKVINRAKEDGSGPVPALTPAQGSAAS